MLEIRRLNLDSSWQITWQKTSILLDPWLIGSEIDYFSAFNKQWHSTPPAKIESLDKYDAILISQHFSDHCHEETLKKLDTKSIVTSRAGAKRVGKIVAKENIQIIPNLLSKQWLKVNDLEIALLPAPKKMSASFSGIVIKNENEIIVYCPHGYDLMDDQRSILNQFKTVLLITSFSTFKLPFIFGGFVNPGLKHAKKLISQTNPTKILATHDEDKQAFGIVKKIAKVNYPNSDELAREFSDIFMDLVDVNERIEIKSNGDYESTCR